MCGIIGYTGRNDVDAVLLPALSRLEYRGYDSAGVAVIDEKSLLISKEVGKLSELKRLVQSSPLHGHIGIGHTRWATHGEPSQRNAHPHPDCSHSLAVAHNGIIENHEILRRNLVRLGHVFSSETDTEVLVHLIEEFHIKSKLSLKDAVFQTLKEIEGSYALCVISKSEKNVLVAARKGSPLVIGVGEGENFIASDATAFLEHTRKALFLDDGECAVISPEKVQVYSREGKPVEKKISEMDWDSKSATKEGYEHFMLKEIEEQPVVAERILRARLAKPLKDSLFDELKFDQAKLKNIKRIWIQACGTSWHAALTGRFFLEGLAQLPVEVEVSSEFRYRNWPVPENTLLLSITQSGETIDTLMGMRRAQEAGLTAISICNVLGSTIARESDGVIYTQAGPEIGVASTKAYTAQLMSLFLFSLYWAELRGTLKKSEIEKHINELKSIPEKFKTIISNRKNISKIAEKYCRSTDFLFLGRGVNYPNAFEGALKIKEIAYIHATGHPAGEMKHGPIALIDEKMPSVCLIPKSPTHEKMMSNIREVKARRGKVIAVATEGDSSISSIADDVVWIPETEEILSPFVVVLPLQYLAYEVALLRGTDVDQPRNLAKSVTVE